MEDAYDIIQEAYKRESERRTANFVGKDALAQKVLAVKRYQQRTDCHPLTCGNDPRHAILEPYIDGSAVKLRCPDCDYTQEYISGVCL
jgi:hypothetical protein